MVPFPENLPPIGLNLFYKYIIYFSILYIVITAVTTKLITNKRLKSIKTIESNKSDMHLADTTIDSINFDNESDKISKLMVEISATQSAINQLSLLKDNNQISNNAYSILNSKYSADLTIFTEEINVLLPEEKASESNINTELTKSVDNIDSILDLGLDDDDEFLKPRLKPKNSHDPTPVAPKQFTAPKPATPKQFTAPKPATPKQFTAPKPVTPKQFTAPKPVTPKQFTAPKPVAPKQFKAPKPSVSNSSFNSPSPKPKTPQVVSPQPQKVESDEKMFAKSTSIAAIRMDMLRELARLKKLINEDD